MRSSVGHEGSFGGNRERKEPGFLQRATAGLAGIALALGGCSIGETGAGASSSPEVAATATAQNTTPAAEATQTPTADRTPKTVAPGELPTVEQLSNLGKDECLMLVAGAFETEDGTSVSRAIATVNGRLTVFGKEACNGGKVEIREEDEVRFFAMKWGEEPDKTEIKQVYVKGSKAANDKASIVYTRNGGVPIHESIQGVSFGPEDMTDWRNVVVIVRLSDGMYYPLGCESEEVDVQTLAKVNDPGVCQ